MAYTFSKWKIITKLLVVVFFNLAFASFQVTSPLAYMFIAVQHNVTVDDPQTEDITYFTSGWKDVCAVFFYFLICIVIHAIVQEYILDVSIF